MFPVYPYRVVRVNVDWFAPEFDAGMRDDTHAGPAKEIALGLRAAGIDLTDTAAVQAWIDQRNREQAQR